MASPEERVCRALCRHDRHPENITFEGAPMWQSYIDQARAALAGLDLGPMLALVDDIAQQGPGDLRDRASVVLGVYRGTLKPRRRRVIGG